MQVTGVTLNQFRTIAYAVSAVRYGGNLTVARDAHSTSAATCTARLSAAVQHGPGSRLARTGTPGPYACWHAYRDVLAALFRHHPDARVRTRMATYRGQAGFEEDYPETAVMDSGRPGRAVYMPDLCRCSHEGMPPKFAMLSRPPGTFAPYLAGLQPLTPPLADVPGCNWPAESPCTCPTQEQQPQPEPVPSRWVYSWMDDPEPLPPIPAPGDVPGADPDWMAAMAASIPLPSWLDEQYEHEMHFARDHRTIVLHIEDDPA
jgi:hypothetical protein